MQESVGLPRCVCVELADEFPSRVTTPLEARPADIWSQRTGLSSSSRISTSGPQ
jgi:hypothetical protein